MQFVQYNFILQYISEWKQVFKKYILSQKFEPIWVILEKQYLKLSHGKIIYNNII